MLGPGQGRGDPLRAVRPERAHPHARAGGLDRRAGGRYRGCDRTGRVAARAASARRGAREDTVTCAIAHLAEEGGGETAMSDHLADGVADAGLSALAIVPGPR